MKGYLIIAAGLLAAIAPALAGDLEERQKLAGSWQETGSELGKTWTIEDTDGQMRIVESLKGETLLDLRCNTMGKQCDFKDEGKHAKVSLWFNGPKLVAMESRGDEVLKRRFKVSPDGGLQIEVIPIAPAGKTETVTLKRVSAQPAAQ